MGWRYMDDTTEQSADTRRTIRIFGREFTVPASRPARVAIGCVLIFAGILGFLPVLGFWMIPLGLLILSYEFALVRRWRRRTEVWWAYRRGRVRANGRTNGNGPDNGDVGAGNDQPASDDERV